MSDELLTLGVEAFLWEHERPFNIGGIGVWEHERPFDIIAPPVVWSHERVFNIGSAFEWTHDRPFMLGEVLQWSHDRLFDIVTDSVAPEVVGPSTASPAAVTALATGAAAGATTVTVTSATGIVVGSRIVVGSEARTVTAVAGPVLTLDVPLSAAWALGTGVVGYAGTTSAAPAVAGATTITVVSATPFVVGSAIRITAGTVTQYRTVTSVAGSVLTLSAPLGAAAGSGALVSIVEAANVIGQMLIFDKAGNPLGALTKFDVPEPRSIGIRMAGNMQVSVPITHPDAALIADDLLLAVVSSVGVPTWGGSIGRQSIEEGKIVANVPEITDLFTGFSIAFSETEQEQVDGAPATVVYGMVIDKLNAIRTAHGEVAFEKDLTGTRQFRGDVSPDGEAIEYLELIARRSQTEWATRTDIVDGRFVPTLMARDTFTAPAGVDFKDGPGGNIEDGSFRFVSDPSVAIRKLKLTGAPSNIMRFVPEWGHWAVHEITPEVELEVPDPTPATGKPRFREDLSVTVDWGLSRAEQERLGNATEDRLWAMFYSYLYAWHDIMAMPFHPSWVYEGPPADLESELTADKWRTHNELALYATTTPAHIVMANPTERKWLVVLFYISGAGAKYTRIIDMDTLYKYPFPTGSLPAGTSVNIYEVVNRRAQLDSVFTWTSGSWLLHYPIVVTNVATGKTMTVRGIVSGPFAGKFVNTSEDPWSLVFDSPSAAIDDETDMITKVFYFERQRIQQWDPRRDGVGELLNRQTVWNGALTTRARWHIVPWTAGDAGETALAQGIYHFDSTIFVESVEGWPTTFPFTIRVGDPLYAVEDMRVIAAFGGRLTVERGTSLGTTVAVAALAGDTVVEVTTAPDATIVTGFAVVIGGNAYVVAEVTGTTIRLTSGLLAGVSIGASVQFTTAAFSFEPGTKVQVVGAEPFDGFVLPYEWPEGLQYAQEYLDRHNRGARVFAFRVFNRGDTWRSAAVYGSTHAIDVTNEGIIAGNVRVLGFSPGEGPGTMEVFAEEIV